MPIYIEGGDGVQALRREQLAAEKDLHPRAGDFAIFGPRKLVWREITLKDQLIDFKTISDAPRRAESCVAYAVTYIHSDSPQTAVLKVGSDDQSRIYCNGKLIYESLAPRSYPISEDIVHNVELKSGLNTIVFKVVNETLEWQGSVRLVDAAGQPLAGTRLSVSPP